MELIHWNGKQFLPNVNKHVGGKAPSLETARGVVDEDGGSGTFGALTYLIHVICIISAMDRGGITVMRIIAFCKG